MNLLVRYKPTGEDFYEFELEEGIKITKQRSKAASCSVALPRTFATENASGYGKLQVLLNDKYLFDGTSQAKDFGKTKINLTGYDFLWDLGKERRMFEQGTTDMTPTEAFEEAFDTDSVFANYDAIWGESYTGPWLAGYNATRFVVPADTAASYGFPFWDCNDKSGVDFMKQLADVCYRGDKYRYFYWYENIKGTKYLFFEPDGWGKTWKNMDYNITQKLKTKFTGIWNNVVVWGKTTGGKFPIDTDYWSEKNIDGWSIVGGNAISLSTTESIIGQYSIRYDINVTINQIFRYFTGIGGYQGINLESLDNLYFQVWPDTGNTNSRARARLSRIGVADFYSSFYSLTANQWNQVTIPLSDFTPTSDMEHIGFLSILLDTDGGTISDYWYIDEIYFNINPIRSANTSTATGYDSTSAGTYSLRTTPPIIWPNLLLSSECDSVASVLVNYYKDPQYNYSIKFANFQNFKLNENINLVKFQEDITLPIDKITWTFKTGGEIETSVDLGSPRLSLGDTLSKYSRDVVKPSKNWGIQYNVY